jgi:hypothetical protein
VATPIDLTPAPAATPAAPTPTQTAQTTSTQAGQNPPTVGAPQGPTGLFTVDQTTEAAAKEVQNANINTAAVWDQINKQQAIVDRYTTGDLKQDAIANPQTLASANATLQTLQNSLSSAQQRVETANAAYSTSLTNAIKANQVDPSQVALAKAQADAATSNADTAAKQVQVLQDGAPSQRALVSAQAGQAAATAAANQASADATKLKAGPEADQLKAQAAALDAQAKSTLDQLPGLIEKTKADTSLTVAQAGLTDANSDLAKANTVKVGADTDLVKAQTDYQKATTTGLLPAQVVETQARAGSEAATAQATLEGIQQKKLGPAYGLQDQIDAINKIAGQVFGPGGTGDPNHANDLLQQYVTATLGGTTIGAASAAAANAQQNIFGTQAAMQNQQVQAAASRANQYAGLAGTTLGQLSQLNQYAPKGSTAMAGAFRGVMDEMAQRLQAPQFQAPQAPQAPELPTFLQGFTAGHRAASATAAQAVSAAGGGQGGGAPPINININGQPAGGAGPPSPYSGPMAIDPSTGQPWATPTGMPGAAYMDYRPGTRDWPAGPPQPLASGSGAPQGGAPQPTVSPQSNAGGQTPQQAFNAGFASNAPTLPNYLNSLTNPMSMLTTAQGLANYNQGPGNGTPQAGSLYY